MRVFNDLRRFIVLVAGRRWAKTTTMLTKMLRAMCEQQDISEKPEDWVELNEGFYGYFAPTYAQAKLIAWDILKHLIPKHYVAKINESELSIRLVNGQVVRLFGLDKPVRLLGMKLKGAIIDEFDQTKIEAWKDVIRPALSDTGGFAWFIGSPDARRKQLKELFDKVILDKDPAWGRYHFRSIDGGYIPVAELEQAKKDLDPKTYREQYEASFETVEGGVYYGFHPHHNTAEVQYKPGLPIRFAWDFNVNPFCTNLSQFIPKIDDETRRTTFTIHTFDEIVIKNASTFELCKAFMEKYPKHRAGVIIYGDPSGNARHTSASNSDYQIIRDMLRNYPGFEVRVKNSAPLEKDRINGVNSKLMSYDGKRHAFINSKTCPVLVRDFLNVQYVKGATHIDKKGDLELTHSTDAWGYMVDYEFPITKGYLR